HRECYDGILRKILFFRWFHATWTLLLLETRRSMAAHCFGRFDYPGLLFDPVHFGLFCAETSGRGIQLDVCLLRCFYRGLRHDSLDGDSGYLASGLLAERL